MWPGKSKVFFNVGSKFYEEIAPFRKDTIIVLIYTVDYTSDCSFRKSSVSTQLETKLDASGLIPYDQTIKMDSENVLTLDLSSIMNNPNLGDVLEYPR